MGSKARMKMSLSLKKNGLEPRVSLARTRTAVRAEETMLSSVDVVDAVVAHPVLLPVADAVFELVGESERPKEQERGSIYIHVYLYLRILVYS